MYRQSPSRNSRSKGIRVRHVLQICLLLAVCFWLIYQVKHSHDKKKEFDESDAKALLKGNSDELIKLGRKDIHSQSDGMISKNEKHDEPIEEEETNGEEEEDVEENKHEEEKPDIEVDREQDIVDDDDKEREDGDETETQVTDNEDEGHVEMEKENPEEDIDHDGDDNSTHEAREEHYKADDASSAVTHDTQMETNENILEEEKKEADNAEETNKGEDRKNLEVEKAENVLDNSGNGSSTNNTVVEGYNGHLTSNGSTEVTMVNHDLSLENVTDGKTELDHGEGRVTEGKSGNSTLNVDDNRISSNSTGSPENKDANFEEFSNSSNNTESSESENKNDETEGEKSDTKDGQDEILETTMNENPEEEVEHDSIDISDSSNSLTENDVRVDLDTLPEIQTEGTDSDDTAAE